MEATTARISIRSPQARDFAAIAELTNIFIRETAIHFACDQLDAEYYTDAHTRDRDRFPWLVADVDGDFAGYAKSSVWRKRAAYRHTAETTVYVGARFRGLGVARALYLRLFDELRELSFHMAVAGVTLPNDASVGFHQSVGFLPVGTFHEVGRKFDLWHDVAWFERQL
jgi:phosphinothricin acetyltransferase